MLLLFTQRHLNPQRNQYRAKGFFEIVLDGRESLFDASLGENDGNAREPRKGHKYHFDSVQRLDVEWCFGTNNLGEETKEKEGGFGVEGVCEKASADSLPGGEFLGTNGNRP